MEVTGSIPSSTATPTPETNYFYFLHVVYWLNGTEELAIIECDKTLYLLTVRVWDACPLFEFDTPTSLVENTISTVVKRHGTKARSRDNLETSIFKHLKSTHKFCVFENSILMGWEQRLLCCKTRIFKYQIFAIKYSFIPIFKIRIPPLPSPTYITGTWSILLRVRDAQIFQKSRNHLKIPGARTVKWAGSRPRTHKY